MKKSVFKKLFSAGTIFSVIVLLAIIGCKSGDHSEGLRESGGGKGPKIVFDPKAMPVPDIPFPNDIATVKDDTSATGLRVNIGVKASTRNLRNQRKQLNTLDGFGTYMPITIRFDDVVDLSTITDDNILLVKLDAPKKGEVVPVDIGKGFFPHVWNPDKPWWRHDPFADANNIDMDPANIADLDGDTELEFVDFYEFKTNTLIIRPVRALEEKSKYAVVLLKGIKGMNGESIRSPFAYINHTLQTQDLKPLESILPDKGIHMDRVAFCWSYTTQSITDEWVRIWEGLVEGKGQLGYLKKKFPPVTNLTDLQSSADADGNSYTLSGAWLGPLLKMIFELVGDKTLAAVMNVTYTDYFVFGKFDSPSFLDSQDFGNPLSTDPHYFEQSRLNGNKEASSLKLKATWVMAVPKDEDLGLDGCQSPTHPHGCKDFEEPGAKGNDDAFGELGVDDNIDGYIDDSGEYLWPGSDDIIDPAGDNYSATGNPTGTQGNKKLDYDFGADSQPGVAFIDDDGNGIVDDITEFGWYGSDDGASEDANGDGRLNTPPFPVSLYGHGHGMGAMEGLGFFAPVNRSGIALISMDAFGHGPYDVISQIVNSLKNFLVGPPFNMNLNESCNKDALSPSCLFLYSPGPGADSFVELVGADLNGDKLINGDDINGKTIGTILDEIFDMGMFRVLATEGRSYDVNGDTVPDSGNIFFTANIFQTRDLIRQTAVDYMQLARIVDSFGTLSVNDLNGDTVPDLEGDFNLDGQYDLGGPPAADARGLFYLGSSLGGIMGDVNMAVNPRILVGAPVAGAAGLPDVIPRSFQRSATVPTLLQICGPIIVGDFNDGLHPPVLGQVQLNFNDDPALSAFGVLDIRPNSKVRIKNIINGETEEVETDMDGNFAMGVAADVGDTLEITSLATGSTVRVASRYHGLGVRRNTPDMRRFISLGQWGIERADPANLAKHYFTGPNGKPMSDYPDKAVLIINTVGDYMVPISTENQLASAAGLWDMPHAQRLLDKGISLGYVPDWNLYYDAPIFDPEDVDDDGLRCGFGAGDPRCDLTDSGLAPFAPVHSPVSDRVSAVRWHYVSKSGHHAFALPGSINNGIDWGVYMVNQIAYFFASDGKCVIDDPWELHSARYIDPGPDRVLQTAPIGDDNIKTIRVLTTLGYNPCEYNFPTIEIIATGPNFVIDTAPAGDDVYVNYDQLYRGP